MLLLHCPCFPHSYKQCLWRPDPCRQAVPGPSPPHVKIEMLLSTLLCVPKKLQGHFSKESNTWIQLAPIYERKKYFYDSLQSSKPESRGFIAFEIKKPCVWSFIPWFMNECIQSPASAHSNIQRCSQEQYVESLLETRSSAGVHQMVTL